MLDMSTWKTFKISDLFNVRYGVNLELNSLDETTKDDKEGVAFVGRSGSNNGITAYVKRLPTVEPQPAGVLTVAGGGSVLSTFLQPRPFYSGRDLFVLYDKIPYSSQVKLFVKTVIEANMYRFNYGRQANMHISNLDILLPIDADGNPNWAWMEGFIDGLNSRPITTSVKSSAKQLDIKSWSEFSVGELFRIINGRGITADEIAEHPGDLEAVQSGENNMGILGLIDGEYCKQMNYAMTSRPCLTVARSGTSGYVSYHPRGCVVGDSAKILLLRDTSAANDFVYLFLRTLLEANRYKYSYGRKVTENGYKAEVIHLPTLGKGCPDWRWIEEYMKSLPYSDRVRANGSIVAE